MRWLIIALLLLGACKKTQAGDDYRFEQREWTHSTFQVVIVEHDTQADLAKAANLKIPEGEELQAYSSIRPSDGRCTIHVLRPEKLDRVWLGHEMAHCVWGRWHPSRGGSY